MSAPQSLHLDFSIAEIAAGTSEVWYLPICAPGTWKLVAAYFSPMTNRTAHDTNYTDISLEKAGTEIASEATTTSDTGNLTAGTAIALALTGTGTNLEFAQGASITIKKTDAGTGLALDGGFGFYFEKVRA